MIFAFTSEGFWPDCLKCLNVSYISVHPATVQASLEWACRDKQIKTDTIDTLTVHFTISRLQNVYSYIIISYFPLVLSNTLSSAPVCVLTVAILLWLSRKCYLQTQDPQKVSQDCVYSFNVIFFFLAQYISDFFLSIGTKMYSVLWQ